VEAVSMRRELWVIIALQADKDPLNLCKLFVSFHYIQSFLSELKEVETYQVCQSLLSFLSFTLSFSLDLVSGDAISKVFRILFFFSF